MGRLGSLERSIPRLPQGKPNIAGNARGRGRKPRNEKRRGAHARKCGDNRTMCTDNEGEQQGEATDYLYAPLRRERESADDSAETQNRRGHGEGEDSGGD